MLRHFDGSLHPDIYDINIEKLFAENEYMVIYGIFLLMAFSCIPFSVGLKINFTVILRIFACISILTIGNCCFLLKMSQKNDFTENCGLTHTFSSD